MNESSFINRPRQVAQRAAISRSTFYEQVSAGLWPKPIRLGGRAVGLPGAEVTAILRARIAGYSDDELRDLVRTIEAARPVNARSTING